MSTSLAERKSFEISKWEVWQAYERVKANKGAPGVDKVTIEEFEADLRGNLYKVWNRMSSGSYFPPPVRAVPIPKPGGGVRMLGVPTVADRIAQTVVAARLEARVEPMFHPDSYGYRPERSALDAVAVARRRCWSKDWVLDLDIRAFFDSVDHDLLLRAVEANTEDRWVLLYVRRWLAAPMVGPDGAIQARDRGTPQGSAVSPVLANLFLHYAFDAWMAREFPGVRFERYVDDVVVHATTRGQAEQLRSAIATRMAEVGLELHPDKTKIVYCKDDNRRGQHVHTEFTFLGYTFRTRSARNKHGRMFASFLPAVSRDALVAMGRQVRRWRIHLRVGVSLADLARWMNPIVRGWMQYYGAFNRSALYPLLRRINTYLVRWARQKYRALHRFKKAKAWWHALCARYPRGFAQWAWTRDFLPTGW
ncbi:MAG: group II intron reverse transcriptase/maturase [Chloroflexota bacterium]|nr:group II intron reverse transcriptase/maturase [Chloroflexota bacterium]